MAHTITTHRRPAPASFIAAGRLVDQCHAELAWSLTDYTRIAGIGQDDGGPHPSQFFQLPHEKAAATLLNVWGHLHPVEARAAVVAERMVAQRAAGWTDRAAGSLADLRFYLAERRKLRATFDAAAAAYRAARAAIATPIAA